MSSENNYKVVFDLIQLDIDAVEAYEQALKNIDDANIHQTLLAFKEDHVRHIKELSNKMIALNEKPPELSQDFKGFLIEGFTAIRSLTGTNGALKAMQSNEKLTNKKYKEAMDEVLPVDIMEIVERNYSDERRHLEYIENILSKGQ